MKVINSFLWECLAIIPSVLMAQTANKQPNIVLILADDMGRELLFSGWGIQDGCCPRN